MSLTTLPALIGMLFTGVLLQNVGCVNINESFSEINKELRLVNSEDKSERLQTMLLF